MTKQKRTMGWGRRVKNELFKKNNINKPRSWYNLKGRKMQLNLTNYSQAANVELLEKPEEIKSKVINKFKYGQYFTKTKIVERILNLILEFKKYSHDVSILEPSFGTGNFLKVLSENNFTNLVGCEIDSTLTENPRDFFDFPLSNKFDLIIGNPPFTKYNVFESYYYPEKYKKSFIPTSTYLTEHLLKKEKEKIENIFILKCIKHLKNKDSSIAFVLPISFFIKNRNKEIKQKIMDKFSTIIIFQNKEVWFDYHIPCCFAIFTNNEEFKDKVVLQYENGESHRHILPISEFREELIPEVVFNKIHGIVQNSSGIGLMKYLSENKLKFKKSFENNNVSAKNILEKIKIPSDKGIDSYKLAVVRVGNSSVGKCGLINIEKDVLNDMFYVLDFQKEHQNNKHIKEAICEAINQNQDYFKNVTCRVGSKSIKKEDVFNFKVELGG